jgi:hypothetical protein
MIANVKCPACPFTARAKVPDDAKKVKCPKCGTRIELTPPEEEFFVDDFIEDEPEPTLAPLRSPIPDMTIPDSVAEPPPPVVAEAPPMVTPAPEVEPTWIVTEPRSFGIFARSITGGVVYDICDGETDEVLGKAKERVDGTKAAVGILVGRHAMQGVILITDEETRETVLVIERENLGVLGLKPAKVRLYDHRDELLATFKAGKQILGGLALDFDADCVIHGDDKEKWGVAKGEKRRNPNYAFHDVDGSRLARVRGKGKTQGFMAAAGSWTGKGGWLKITLDDAFDASPAQKLLVLGVVIAIESLITTVKETKPGQIRLS